MASDQKSHPYSFENLMAEAVFQVVEERVSEEEALSAEHDEGRAVYTPRTMLDYVEAVQLLPAAVDEIMLKVARQAHSEGYTWGEIAKAAGLSSGQIAHHRWAEGREQRLDSLKKRVGGRRPSMATPGVPGRSAAEAARLLGCDVRTLPTKVAAGEIQSRQITLNSGGTRTRYFLPGDQTPD
ncbi:hypothetical protein [Pseudarthrobacter phenanthrenivorans]|uniref:Uncharacterized protein n=1 Tax=Pseudarthrobacter phenanthrenivorans TaxID=361575 RepID=A0A0B4DIP5_PSEPS|nr:hypothetical protein [Pseudarthrobacter phenanthrenivorans]KIC68702.1 hypothetical protein RM50_04375 [Pseudarthrobacter phenanthrenivorans]